MNSLEKGNNLIENEIELINENLNETKIDNLNSIFKNTNIIINPMVDNSKFNSIYGEKNTLPKEYFIQPLEVVNYKPNNIYGTKKKKKNKEFLIGGPRKHLFFNPYQVKVAIVTCGGLCPGLNVVIRELYKTLRENYLVRQIFGVKYGFKGFFEYDWEELNDNTIQNIHKIGGTILGTSRGGFNLEKIIEKIEENQINQIYIIGGDGTHRGAIEIYNEIKIKKLMISVVCIPKTIDNDIPYIDRSFGFLTSIESALNALESAEIEAQCCEYGVGLVKLMGRNAGHIAMQASYSFRSINICLIPEFKYNLYGKNGLLNYVYKVLKVKRKCVIVVSEGCSVSFLDKNIENLGKDPSGNIKYGDVGLMLKEEIVNFCKSKSLNLTLKYIDPTYMIRTNPANSSDKNLCAQISHDAVHGAMAGFTGFSVGIINNLSAYIPLKIITSKTNLVKNSNKEWQRLIASTGQPSFLTDLNLENNKEKLEVKDKSKVK